MSIAVEKILLVRNDVVDVEQNVKFCYTFDDKSRRYFADFLVTYNTGKKILYEVKPFAMIDWAINLAKFDAARVQIHKLGIDEFKIVTEKELYVVERIE